MAVSWREGYVRYRQYFLNIALFYKKRQDVQMFLEILLSLGAIAIFLLGALRPTFLTIAKLLTDIKQKEQTLVIMDQKIGNLNKAKSTYNQEVSKIPLLDSAIPDKSRPVEYVRQLEGVSQKNGISVARIAVGEVPILGESASATSSAESPLPPPVAANNFKISIDVEGSYTSLVSFLKDIENLRRPLILNEVFFVLVPQENQILLTVNGLVPYLERGN